jgi:hypothetical protein
VPPLSRAASPSPADFSNIGVGSAKCSSSFDDRGMPHCSRRRIKSLGALPHHRIACELYDHRIFQLAGRRTC